MNAALSECAVIVPARNEAAAIAAVVGSLRRLGATRVIVVDDASSDGTPLVARAAGAEVVSSPRRGYGWACHTGAAVATTALVAFIDGDGSFDANDLARLAALVRDGAELAVGTRDGTVFMSLPQRIGNALTLAVLRALYGLLLRDVAPLRVIRREALERLEMRPTRYAWLVEMLIKAARQGLRIRAIPVHYGPRVGGESKVSGSLRGSVLTGVDFVRALIAYLRW